MSLETATYVSQLVSSNPAATDPVGQGDDHLRLIKSTILATLPNWTAAALNSTQAQIDTACLNAGSVSPASGNFWSLPVPWLPTAAPRRPRAGYFATALATRRPPTRRSTRPSATPTAARVRASTSRVRAVECLPVLTAPRRASRAAVCLRWP